MTQNISREQQTTKRNPNIRLNEMFVVVEVYESRILSFVPQYFSCVCVACGIKFSSRSISLLGNFSHLTATLTLLVTHSGNPSQIFYMQHIKYPPLTLL